MRKLNPKEYKEEDFNSFIYNKSKNNTVKSGKERIENKILKIRDRFDEYEDNKSKLEKIGNSPFTKTVDKCNEKTQDLCGDLFKLYDSKSKDNKKFKDEIRKISEIKCPYCGIDTPIHLDHFLPRSKFPEFSVYSPNLVAVCADCNSGYKGDDIVDEKTGSRKFFNPYFDDFIDTIQFLKCHILVKDKYPKFEFCIDDSLVNSNLYEYTIMKNHFKNLNLKNRYIVQIAKEKFIRFKNEYIIPETMEFEEDITLKDLKRDIQKRLRGFKDCNQNNWEKVFWEALKESNDCLNLIVEKKIPTS